MSRRQKEASNQAQAALENWYDQHRASEQEAERYVVCAGLAVTEHMRKIFPLSQSDYVTKKNQVKTSGSLIEHILQRHGISRKYASEGGRTTRGTRPAAEALVQALHSVSALTQLTDSERSGVLDALQAFLIAKVRAFFDRQRLEVEISLQVSALQNIAVVLDAARERKVAGAVAQHLVGAKLQLRFPSQQVENHSHTTADIQLGRPGDFLIGDTTFHVTVSPTEAVVKKCAENLRQGYRTLLLVPETTLAAARQLVEIQGLKPLTAVYSIESFIAQNLEEISEFGQPKLRQSFKSFLETYNRRVAEAETDLSLLIDIPGNL